MTFKKISLGDYASSVQAEGVRVIQHGATWWREVRPFFYRPLLPYQELQVGTSAPGLRAVLGGFQHVVPNERSANSAMEFLMFTDAKNYSIDRLNADRRWEVRTALKRFTVRPFHSSAEFSEKAHPIYLSFYQRTRYSYFTARLNKLQFARWAESIYSGQEPMVLGAFAGPELAAVSISRAIGDTLLFSTFFARQDALRQHVSSLMLHTVRMAAAEAGDITNVFAGMRKTGAAQSVDAFYLHRGCVIKCAPAHLQLSSVVKAALGTFRPRLLRQLAGKPVT